MNKYQIKTKEIKKLMIDNGFDTIASLADVTGINRITLSRVLKGEQLPSADTMYALAKHLHMTAGVAGEIFFAD